ncbi:hypothetical protein [Chitinimonas sp. BJYL2]|uniref:hypothetical protein n=1 Tax=Chitinimonas sp. BJYL2 TaxID=2976696 RepID=UPI0022B3A9A0|nr:hypothetical protein [Chitinimonas sp. BJYL2]
MRQLILAALFAAASSTAFAAADDTAAAKKPTKPAKAAKADKKTAAPAPATAPVVNVALRDYSTAFAKNYDTLATYLSTPIAPPAPPATPDKKDAKAPEVKPQLPQLTPEQLADIRWKIYKDTSPYTTGSDEAASKQALLDAWPKYEPLMPQIRQGAAGLQPTLSAINTALANLVYLEKPVALRYIVYVDTFKPSYRSEWDGTHLNFYFPLEQNFDTMLLPFTRTLSRHFLANAAVWGDRPRSLVELIIQEGVAAHMIAAVIENQPAHVYLGLSQEQVQQLTASRKDDLKEVISRLAEPAPANPSVEQLARYRYAGWLLVDYLQKQDIKLYDLIRQRQSDLVRGAQLATGSVIRAK